MSGLHSYKENKIVFEGISQTRKSVVRRDINSLKVRVHEMKA